jgi:two-component system chemotaxis sensor kinase CheA
MDKRDQVLQIFLIESTEIIENLEIQIINLEEDKENKDLINDIFRGVHTLKGNSNSFGFTKLGGIVHYFEDLLDYYREPNNSIEEEVFQLIFDTYDIIKETFEIEKMKEDRFPSKYAEILKAIKDSLDKTKEEKKNKEKENNPGIVTEEVVHKQYVFHDKFDKTEIDKMSKEGKEEILKDIKNDKKIFNIIMEFEDRDYYFITLLKELGEIKQTFITLKKEIDEGFNPDKEYVKKISIYLSSEEDLEEIEEVFDLKDDEEIVNISILCEDLFLEQEIVKPEQKEKEDSKIETQTNKIETQTNKIETQTKKVEKGSSIRVDSNKIDELFDSIGELVIAQSYIDQNEEIRNLKNLEINKYLNMLNKTTRIIQSKVMNIRMLPIRDTFFKMKRVVRDVSKKTEKEINFQLSGEDTEIDKTMIDNLSEPLIHMIRNSIDHGIEDSSEERVKNGKPEMGTVLLKALHRGSSFIIEIHDDGKGIDTESILTKAIDKGIASKEEIYKEEEILQFLFAPGFSTAAEITSISGRGVGLDVVKKTITDMKGKIQIETKKGKGSVFRIVLPLTLAIIDGMVVKSSEEIFIIPTLSVVESFRPKKEDIQTIKNKVDFINFRGNILPILQLNKILDLDEEDYNIENSTFICIDHDKGMYVLQVDELLGRQQIVIKALSKKFEQVKEISGATIMGNGEIALILNIEGIREWLDNNVEGIKR